MDNAQYPMTNDEAFRGQMPLLTERGVTFQTRREGNTMKRSRILIFNLLLAFLIWRPTYAQTRSDELPGRYFQLLEAGATQVEERLNAQPKADLKSLETDSNWRHFPYAILAPAVLYAKRHPSNARYGDARMRALAIRIGDLLADEHER